MGGTKRDDARNQARLLISELNDQSYHDSVQVPLATDGKKKLGKAILYKNTVFNPKVTSCSMHEMDLLVYQEAFLAQCPKDLCSAVREFLDLMGTHSRETSLANVRPGLHTNASSPEDSITVAHKTFALRETQLTSLPINDLVHPSGTLKDRLGVLLHWPTQVTTSEPPEQNETADPGGPCPQLLMRKGVPVDGVLWLDTFARRVEHLKKEDRNRNLSPMDLWPREWRECHLQFSKWVFESSKAKVWVIHGRVNREIYQEWYQADLVPFETKCKHEISVSGAIHIGGANSVLRVIIWAIHPEALFKTAKTEQFRGLRADQA
jgi:hypothetical protein